MYYLHFIISIKSSIFRLLYKRGSFANFKNLHDLLRSISLKLRPPRKNNPHWQAIHQRTFHTQLTTLRHRSRENKTWGDFLCVENASKQPHCGEWEIMNDMFVNVRATGVVMTMRWSIVLIDHCDLNNTGRQTQTWCNQIYHVMTES